MLENQIIRITNGIWKGRHALYKRPSVCNPSQSVIQFPGNPFVFAIPNEYLMPIQDHRPNEIHFLQVMAKNEYGQFYPIPIQQIRIGHPCILQLADGTIVQTSKVQSWTTYGHTEIRTAHSIYYTI